MKPTVGRIVHFTPSRADGGAEPEPRAAIITYVHGETLVNLHAFAQHGADGEAGLQTSIEKKSSQNDNYCWDWPPREE